jgi:hypothetical protein
MSAPSQTPRPPMLMADLREDAARVNWDIAHDDGLAVLQGRITAAQLPADRRDNLQHAERVMAELAQNENHYRVESVKRLDMYDDLNKEYTKYVQQRDEAARQGMAGSAGLAVIYSVDMVSHGLAAAGIPIAKFYATIRGVSDKAVAAYDTLRPLLSSTPDGRKRSEGEAQIGNASATGSRSGSSAAVANSAANPNGAGEPGRRVADRLPEQKIRAVTEPLAVAGEIHKAIEATVDMDSALAGIDRVKQWTTRQEVGAGAAQSKSFTVSKGVGRFADTTLKMANSVADVVEARRSKDEDRIFDAESQALRSSLQSGATIIDLAQKVEELQGIHGPSGEFPVAAQVMKGFQVADKVVGGAQSAVKLADAYYDARDGRYQKAWDHAQAGVVTAAKTFTAYGEQMEAGGKAIDALNRSLQATNTRDKTKDFIEYAGYATKAGGIPGAGDAGDAILKAKDVVEQGFNFADAYDLGRQDTFKPGLDRLGREIKDDYALYSRLNQFRPLFNLPGVRQSVNLPSNLP